MSKFSDSYCGCCGEPTSNFIWCDKCKMHVLNHGPMEERTYFAQHNEPCPFEDRSEDLH